MKELQTIQCELKAPKNLENKFGHYKYRSCEGIMEAVKPLLKKLECTLLISDDIVMCGDRYYIKATATFSNKEGEKVCTTAFAREEEVKKGMDASQVTGACSSYARKYALNGLFCIDDTKDSDATNTGEEDNLSNAIKKVNQCATREELVSLWNELEELQGNKRFLSAMSARKKQLKSA